MNAQQIIDRALRLTHTNVNDYKPEQSIEDLNLVYQDMVDEIVVVTKGDYFWDTWSTKTVVNQSEYVAEKLWIAPDDLDIKKINKVFVKYDSNDEYKTQLKYRNPWVLDKHPDYYKVNQPRSDAFFYIQDESIFIYPTITESIGSDDPWYTWEQWLELFCIHKPADLTTSSTEDDIEIPTQFHKVIADWLKTAIYQSQGKLNEAQVAEQDYQRWIQNMVSFMKQRYNQPRRKTITWLDDFR